MNLPNKKYNIIYADPPWSYGDKLKHWGGGANSHYDTMKLSEIKEMNISEISEKNCILFLWATFPNLQ